MSNSNRLIAFKLLIILKLSCPLSEVKTAGGFTDSEIKSLSKSMIRKWISAGYTLEGMAQEYARFPWYPMDPDHQRVRDGNDWLSRLSAVDNNTEDVDPHLLIMSTLAYFEME